MCAIQTTPRIETERLVLRPPAMHDAWRIADLINDYDIARMTTRVPHPYALTDAEDFLAMQGRGDEQAFAIEHKTFGLIGMVGFHHVEGPFPEAGYWLGRTFWGRGFATEALKGALDWVQRDWGKRAILAGHFADNLASCRVLIKAGFLHTGEVQQRHSAARGEIAPTRMMVWLA